MRAALHDDVVDSVLARSGLEGMTFDHWLHAFWDEIAVPHTLRNAHVGIAWMYTESGDNDGTGQGGRWNPLNTTWRLTSATAPSGHASTDFNWVPVQNYATFQDGLYATKRTLLQSQYGFPKIVSRLRHKWWSAKQVLNAIEDSAWGTQGLIFDVFKDVAGDYYDERADTLVAGSWL